jgi:ESS family glutamate:Na+ symporter
MSFIGGLDLGNFGEKTLKPLVYGFNFFWGILFGSLVKIVIRRLRKSGWMTREYLNEFLLNRVSGISFDVMIVAGTAAISFENLRSIWMPLTIVCVLGAVVTFFYVRWVSLHIYPGYGYEGFFSMFGMLTGTASNGMILLREIDPRYETPAANNLVLQNIPAMVMGFPVLLLLGFAPKSLNATLITLGILSTLFVVATLFLFRKRK